MTLKEIMIAGKLTVSEGGGGGGISVDGIAQNLAPSGDIVLGSGVTEIKDHAFQGKPITSVKGDYVKNVGQFALDGTQITEITDTNFPKLGVESEWTLLLRLPTTCTAIKLTGDKIKLNSGSGGLRECKGLISAEFPNAAKSLASPNNMTMGNYCFAAGTALTLVDAGFARSVASYAFYNCSSFGTLILRYTSVVPLAGLSAFNGTKFASGGAGGTIYIPKVLYDHLGDNSADDYQHASNWSTVHGYGTITWAQIEGSPYEL